LSRTCSCWQARQRSGEGSHEGQGNEDEDDQEEEPEEESEALDAFTMLTNRLTGTLGMGDLFSLVAGNW